MLTLSLVRHGKTEGNLRGAFVGSTDQPLSPQGREQLAALAGRYRPPELLFASPMLRCVQTAEILYPGHTPILVEGLREYCFGDFEDMTHAEIIARPGYERWGMDEASMVFPGGEGMADFSKRCTAAFCEAAGRCVEAGVGHAAMVIHGGVIMAVLAELCPPPKAYHDWWCDNGCGYLAEWDGAALAVAGRLGGDR